MIAILYWELFRTIGIVQVDISLLNITYVLSQLLWNSLTQDWCEEIIELCPSIDRNYAEYEL